VYDVWLPPELLYRFKYASRKKYAPLVIIRKKCIVLVSVNEFSVEIIFVIYEIDLHPGCGNGRHLNDEWPVNLSYDNIHP
jgi:hypothetical protein